MKYEELPEITKEEAEAKLGTVTGECLCKLLLAMSSLSDWQWVQSIYLEYAHHSDRWVAAAAIIGLGHLAMSARRLDKAQVLPVLEAIAQSNPDLAGKVGDAISDIEVFER
jgi:hypothetical protein